MIKEQPFPDKEENDGDSPEIEFETLRVTPKGYPEISPDQAMNGEIGFVVIGKSHFYYSRARGEFIPVGTSAYCFGCKDFDAASSMIPSTNDSNVFSHESCCTKPDGSRSHHGVEFSTVSDVRGLVSGSLVREQSREDSAQMHELEKTPGDRIIQEKINDLKTHEHKDLKDMELFILRLRKIIDACEYESIDNPQNPEILIFLLKLLEGDFHLVSTVNIYRKFKRSVKSLVINPAGTVFLGAFFTVNSLVFGLQLLYSFFAGFLIAYSIYAVFSRAYFVYREFKKMKHDIRHSVKIFELIKTCLNKFENIHLAKGNPSLVSEFQQRLQKVRSKLEATHH